MLRRQFGECRDEVRQQRLHGFRFPRQALLFATAHWREWQRARGMAIGRPTVRNFAVVRYRGDLHAEEFREYEKLGSGCGGLSHPAA
jgi:hypothetical protein